MLRGRFHPIERHIQQRDLQQEFQRGWRQHPAGWTPPRIAAIPRWLRLLPVLAWIVGVLGVLGWVAAHDPAPGLRLSSGGWVTVVTLAGVGYLAWDRRRKGGTWALLRWTGESALAVTMVVSLLMLARAPAATPALMAQARVGNALKAAGHCPPPSDPLAWLSCLRRVTSATPDSPTNQGGR